MYFKNLDKKFSVLDEFLFFQTKLGVAFELDIQSGEVAFHLEEAPSGDGEESAAHVCYIININFCGIK